MEFFDRASPTGDRGHFVLPIEIANLTQDVELGTRWLIVLLFIPAVWQVQKIKLKFFPVGRLWDISFQEKEGDRLEAFSALNRPKKQTRLSMSLVRN